MSDKLLVNRAQCLLCKDIIISKHQHDFVTCKCGSVSTDGGEAYLRRSAKRLEDIKDLSLYQSSPWEETRQNVFRGSRGKNGDQPLTWVPLNEMSDLYLEALIDYKELHEQTQDIHYWCYQREWQYRYNQNISVLE